VLTRREEKVPDIAFMVDVVKLAALRDTVDTCDIAMLKSAC